jgi:hypothetical protein
MEKEKTGFATAALVLGIIGVVLSFIPIINNAAFVLGAQERTLISVIGHFWAWLMI